MVDDEVGEDEETDPKIHCLGDTSPSPHLTQSAYEKSLMDNQLNELSKGEKSNENQNKYNLRSNKEGNPSTSDHPNKTKNSAKAVVSSSKEKEEQNPQTMIKALF
jgi:hypothetical protein